MKNINELKTFEGACKVLNLNSKTVIPAFLDFSKKDQKAMIAHAKLVIITKAVNQLANNGKEWKPDWNNGKWDKYHAWFWMDGKGSSGFRFFAYVIWASDSAVGSRLCFISREACEHVGKTFTKLFKDYFVM